MRLLLVEDNRTNLMVLETILRKIAGIEIEAFLDPVEAIQRAETQLFDLVLVDFQMPNIDGRTFIARLRGHEAYRHIPIVMVTADSNRQTRIDSIQVGATDFLTKPVDPVELKARVGNLLILRQQQLDLADRAEWLAAEVAKATKHLADREEEVIWRLSRALDYRDEGTGEHTTRVATVSRLIAETLGLPTSICRTIYLAAPLHDIGKVAIPDSILLKSGRLTPDELAAMRRHVELGEDILADGSSDLIRIAAKIAAGHHERWDGSGYPRQLHGEQIALEARIVAVADVFDALCTERPYKRAWSPQDARLEIERQSGAHFDPEMRCRVRKELGTDCRTLSTCGRCGGCIITGNSNDQDCPSRVRPLACRVLCRPPDGGGPCCPQWRRTSRGNRRHQQPEYGRRCR
jgi:putative two-component system response regulator